MNKIRVIFTFIIVLAISILAIFQMDIRGFEKVERINEWVLYYGEDLEVDDELLYPHYIVKSGFEEMSLDDAIEDDLFDAEELEYIMDLIDGLE